MNYFYFYIFLYVSTFSLIQAAEAPDSSDPIAGQVAPQQLMENLLGEIKSLEEKLVDIPDRQRNDPAVEILQKFKNFLESDIYRGKYDEKRVRFFPSVKRSFLAFLAHYEGKTYYTPQLISSARTTRKPVEVLELVVALQPVLTVQADPEKVETSGTMVEKNEEQLDVQSSEQDYTFDENLQLKSAAAAVSKKPVSQAKISKKEAAQSAKLQKNQVEFNKIESQMRELYQQTNAGGFTKIGKQINTSLNEAEKTQDITKKLSKLKADLPKFQKLIAEAKKDKKDSNRAKEKEAQVQNQEALRSAKKEESDPRLLAEAEDRKIKEDQRMAEQEKKRKEKELASQLTKAYFAPAIEKEEKEKISLIEEVIELHNEMKNKVFELLNLLYSKKIIKNPFATVLGQKSSIIKYNGYRYEANPACWKKENEMLKDCIFEELFSFQADSVKKLKIIEDEFERVKILSEHAE